MLGNALVVEIFWYTVNSFLTAPWIFCVGAMCTKQSVRPFSRHLDNVQYGEIIALCVYYRIQYEVYKTKDNWGTKWRPVWISTPLSTELHYKPCMHKRFTIIAIRYTIDETHWYWSSNVECQFSIMAQWTYHLRLVHGYHVTCCFHCNKGHPPSTLDLPCNLGVHRPVLKLGVHKCRLQEIQTDRNDGLGARCLAVTEQDHKYNYPHRHNGTTFPSGLGLGRSFHNNC